MGNEGLAITLTLNQQGRLDSDPDSPHRPNRTLYQGPRIIVTQCCGIVPSMCPVLVVITIVQVCRKLNGVQEPSKTGKECSGGRSGLPYLPAATNACDYPCPMKDEALGLFGCSHKRLMCKVKYL